jgi:hypothetical protein
VKAIVGGVFLTAALATIGPADAATMQGGAALSFAALIGKHAPTLSGMHKYILAKFLAGHTQFLSSNAAFSFNATEVHCRYGDVDLTEHACTLTFGSINVDLTGSESNNLLATMALAGVQGDGAAGTIHYDIKAITCTIKVGEIKSPDGGGAACTYTQS